MVTLTASGNSVVFTFENSNHYLYGNGEIEVPKDSLILVIDKSDIVTFRKIDGDVFVSFNINDSNFSSKDEIEEFYKENMVGGGGSVDSGQVQTQIDQSISGKVDTSVFDTYSANTNTELNNKLNKDGTYIRSFTSTNGNLVYNDGINRFIQLPKINGDAITYNSKSYSLVETSAITSSVTSASTDTEIPSAKAVFDAILTGGTSYQAGRGIDITNDTISFNLPISAGTGTNSLLMNEGNIASGAKSIAGGQGCSATIEGGIALGQIASVNYKGNWGVALGSNTTASQKYAMAVNNSNQANGEASFVCGSHNIVKNNSEYGSGFYNNSVTASTESGKTLFSVGNGTSNTARHNAFEIRQNGDIYISKDGQDIKLQDNLGGEVSSAITSGDTNAVAGGAVYDHLNTVESVIATSLNDLNERKLDASAYTPTDLSNYYTKSETSGATEIANALSAKSDTGDVYTYIAADGRIKIQNASGVNRKSIGLNLPIYSGSSTTNLSLTTKNDGSTQGSNQISGTSAVGIGYGLITKNNGEVAVGAYNNSSYASQIFGNSGNTLFSVGNGTASSSSQRKNAFEIRQNNDIYVRNENGYPVKLQDYVQYKIVKLSQADYDALVQGGTVDANTVYFITTSNS